MEALLIIDMQNDFMPGGALAVPGADACIPYIAEKMANYSCIIATQDWHPHGHVSFASTHNKPLFSTLDVAGMHQVMWPDHCVMNTSGAAFVDGLPREQFSTVIQKGCDKDVDSYSAFFDNARIHESPLRTFCTKQGVTTLHVVGVALDYCVLFSVLDALELGYSVHVDTKGCRGVEAHPGDCAQALETMRQRGALILE